MAVADSGEHHSDWHRDEFGWLANDLEVDQVYVDVAALSFDMLEALCTDTRVNRGRHDQLGWLDRRALNSLWQIDSLARFVLPSEKVSDEERHQFLEHVQALRGALPWSEGERQWLLPLGYGVRIDPNADDRDVAYLDEIARQTGEVVSEGKIKDVVGAELLERFRQWRRVEGEYGDGAGLAQARTALAGLINVLRPSMGLPAEFEERLTSA